MKNWLEEIHESIHRIEDVANRLSNLGDAFTATGNQYISNLLYKKAGILFSEATNMGVILGRHISEEANHA